MISRQSSVTSSRALLWQTRIGWLIRARWGMAFFVGLLGLIAAVGGAGPVATPLLAVAMAWSVSNLVFVFVEHHSHRQRDLHFEVSVTAQSIVDGILIAGLVHGTGGWASPFTPWMAIPPLAAIMMTRGSLASAVSVVALLGLVIGGLVGGGGNPADLAEALPGSSWVAFACLVAMAAFVAFLSVRLLRNPSPEGEAGEPNLGRRSPLRPVPDGSVARERAPEIEDSHRHLVAEMSTRIARRIREPLGILRARAESLQLSTRGLGEEVTHDLEVLRDNLEVVHRGLRGILAFLPPSRVRSQVSLQKIFAAEALRVGLEDDQVILVGHRSLPAVPGSHDELELATGLLLRMAAESRSEGARIRVRVRRRRDRFRVDVRFPVEPRKKESGRRTAEEQIGHDLRWMIAGHIVQKHNGDLTERRVPGCQGFRVELPLEDALAAVPLGEATA